MTHICGHEATGGPRQPQLYCARPECSSEQATGLSVQYSRLQLVLCWYLELHVILIWVLCDKGRTK
jgi:hypothetical protein